MTNAEVKRLYKSLYKFQSQADEDEKEEIQNTLEIIEGWLNGWSCWTCNFSGSCRDVEDHKCVSTSN